MNLYLSATVGNGLVSQMTALLVSVSTGMMVTRSASESDLSAEVFNQFFSTNCTNYRWRGNWSIDNNPWFPSDTTRCRFSITISIGVVMRNRMKLSSLHHHLRNRG